MEKDLFKKLSSVMVVVLLLGTINVYASNNQYAGEQSGNKTDNAPDWAEAVDLGLSVMWANGNVGAVGPNKFGRYYAWGEPKTYYVEGSDFEWYPGKEDGYSRNTKKSYKHFDTKRRRYIKYTVDQEGGNDHKTILEPEDDAAHNEWGGDWRMPTIQEMVELRNNCSFILISEGRRKFVKVTSDVEGYTDKYILIPLAGWLREDYVDDRKYDLYAAIWSSNLVDDRYSDQEAYRMYFRYDDPYPSIYGESREYGLSVRAVRPKTEAELLQNKQRKEELERIAKEKAAYKSDNAPDGVVAVDLGLSVKWASCNVGTDKPEGYGKHYAWGEVEPRNNFDWSNYKHCRYRESNGYPQFIKYYSYDNLTELAPEDDVAHVVWGGNWRMPTADEVKELMDSKNCKWTFTSQNDVTGYLITSKKPGFEGQSIFLPSAGGFDDNGHSTSGMYWTSTLSDMTGNMSSAYGLAFGSYGCMQNSPKRCNGLSVRPVCPK